MEKRKKALGAEEVRIAVGNWVKYCEVRVILEELVGSLEEEGNEATPQTHIDQGCVGKDGLVLNWLWDFIAQGSGILRSFANLGLVNQITHSERKRLA